MKVIGITGGIGAGKSSVLELLETHFNAFIIKADDVAKETMEPDGQGYQKIVELFGDEILNIDRKIDRKKLADIVFHNKNKLIVLNSIIHPLVKKIITEQIGYLRCAEKYDYIFIEAALLIEDHYDILCDEMWYIFASDEIRMERLKLNRGYSDEKIKSILNNQLQPSDFRKYCKYVINNELGLSDTLDQIKKILNQE